MTTQISQGRLDACFIGFNAAFNRGLALVDNDYLAWSMVLPSTHAVEAFPLSLVDTCMREWIGNRKITALNAGEIRITNKSFSNGVSVNRDMIDDDQLGFAAALFESLAISGNNLWPELAIEALTGAGKWADGKDFFSAARKIGKSTIKNVSSEAFSAAAYASAYADMMAYADAGGNPLKLVPDLLVVGPSNRGAAKRVVEAEIVAENSVAVSNVERGSAKLQINNMLVGDHAGEWYLMCTTRGIKPVAVSKRKSGALTRVDREGDEPVFMRNENFYGVHSRGASVATLPWLVFAGGRA
ncbi:MAG: Mu-like prophage major head subunit gpT family protein [Victivallaceae bacterium]|nr:Mu-like prophage major head subunit gpT family protein [Victivallaceae bacterium]